MSDVLRRHRVALLLAMLVAGGVTVLTAQSVASRPPVAAELQGEMPLARPIGQLSPALRRPVTVRLSKATLVAALGEIARQAGLGVSYDSTVRGSTAKIILNVADVTAAQAILDVVRQAGFEAVVGGDGESVRVRRATESSAAIADSGSIEGTVTDAKTSQPIGDVDILLEGTRYVTRTGGDGQIRALRVPAGDYTLIARRIGYRPASIGVVVHAGQAARVTIVLEPAVTRLEEVVTTATGEQRKLEVGNLIETIAADSIVATSPITSLSDVISARAPGVQVFSPGGFTGASPQLNIRGQNSFTLSNQPLLYVDGVRVENSSVNDAAQSPSNEGTGLLAGRFNDLNPNEIESIEVVKGPSAATLYGTDAANGVILVKTKRGLSSAPRLSFFANGGFLTTDRSRFPDSYTAWGRPTGGGPTQFCPLVLVTAGACTQDSITTFSPFKNPITTPLARGYRQEYGGQLSGGSERVRYFFSAAYADETAPLSMPALDAHIVDSIRGGSGTVTGDERRPNAVRKVSLRENVTTQLGKNADLTLSTGFLSQSSRIPDSFLWFSGALGQGYRDASDGWFSIFGRPSDRFVERHSEDVKHVTASVSSNWRPWSWLTLRGTTGLDYSTDFYDFLIRPGEDPSFPNLGVGNRTNRKTNIGLYTVDLGASAVFALSRAIQSKTSAGAQYNRRYFQTSAASASNLVPGSQTVGGGSTQLASESSIETIVAGAYGEQTFSLRDRLYLTGAIRLDGGSAFGANFSTSVYPKASVSWLAPRPPGVSSLRFRAAYGASGVQPGVTDALATVIIGPGVTPGGTVTGGSIGSLGNPGLKSERQSEVEGGMDLELLDGAVHLEGTYYRKRSSDALVDLPLPPSVGGGKQRVNVGSVQNWGLEGLLRADVLRGRGLAWMVTFNGSINHNKLLKLAPGLSSIPFTRLVEGYPLLSVFDRPITGVKDLNGDGIVEPNEVTIGPDTAFIGSQLPTSQLTVGTSVALFSGRLRVSTQFDRRAGFTLNRGIELNRCFFGTCRAANDAKSPLDEQAAFVAATNLGNFSGYWQGGSFTRWRELSVGYSLPDALARWFGARTAALTLSARNLALWTKFGGIDPESNGGVTRFDLGVYSDLGSPPQSRYWLLRLDVGF